MMKKGRKYRRSNIIVIANISRQWLARQRRYWHSPNGDVDADVSDFIDVDRWRFII